MKRQYILIFITMMAVSVILPLWIVGAENTPPMEQPINADDWRSGKSCLDAYGLRIKYLDTTFAPYLVETGTSAISSTTAIAGGIDPQVMSTLEAISKEPTVQKILTEGVLKIHSEYKNLKSAKSVIRGAMSGDGVELRKMMRALAEEGIDISVKDLATYISNGIEKEFWTDHLFTVEEIKNYVSDHFKKDHLVSNKKDQK